MDGQDTLAWKIPWMEEPGRLQSMGQQRVGHDCVTSLSLFTFMHWRRKWQPTAVFLPGESQGRGSLVGCRLWGRIELDMTEATQQQQQDRGGECKRIGECVKAGESRNASILKGKAGLHWRRKWQTCPVFLPGEFHGHRRLADYSPWGHKESDMTK